MYYFVRYIRHYIINGCEIVKTRPLSNLVYNHSALVTVQWQIFFSLSNTNINWNGAYSSKDILIQICIHLISTEIWNPSKGWRKIEEGRLGKQWVTDQMRRMDINDKTFVVVSISSGPCQTCGHFPHLKSLTPLRGHK